MKSIYLKAGVDQTPETFCMCNVPQTMESVQLSVMTHMSSLLYSSLSGYSEQFVLKITNLFLEQNSETWYFKLAE